MAAASPPIPAPTTRTFKPFGLDCMSIRTRTICKSMARNNYSESNTTRKCRRQKRKPWQACISNLYVLMLLCSRSSPVGLGYYIDRHYYDHATVSVPPWVRVEHFGSTYGRALDPDRMDIAKRHYLEQASCAGDVNTHTTTVTRSSNCF